MCSFIVNEYIVTRCDVFFIFNENIVTRRDMCGFIVNAWRGAAMKRYMGMRAALIDPGLLKPALEFHVASASYLVYIATGGDTMKAFSTWTFPLEDNNYQLLGCLPEFVVDNIMDVIMITKRFKSTYFQVVHIPLLSGF